MVTPEDPELRTPMLAKLLSVEKFELALKFPFVRNQNEVAETAFTIINTRLEHIIHLFDRLPRNIVDTIFKSLYQHDQQGFLELLQKAFLDLHEAKLSVSTYIYHAVKLLSWCQSADMDIFQIIDADPNKALLLQAFSDIKTWENRDTFQQPYHLIFSILYHYRPEEFSAIVFEHIQSTMKERSLYSLCSCIRAIHEVTQIKIELPQDKMNILVDHLKNHMSDALEYSTEIDVLAKYIPDFTKLLLELIAKNLKDQDKLPYNYKHCLDELVRNSGFDQILHMCKDLNMTNCCDYLTKKFGKFPDILEKMSDAIKPYSQLFDELDYLIEDSARWSFFDKLRTAILDAAKNHDIVIINVAEIAQQSGIASELMPMMIMMPGIAIKSSVHEVDEEIKKEVKQSITSLIQKSRERSGLVSSPKLPADHSPEVITDSPKSKL